MSTDLPLPQVPEAKPEDPEDVSWALSTAEAMWSRGDHAEGIKWVRRAAEAASEAEADVRALELAKAAADLASLVVRASRASIDLEEVEPLAEPAPPPLPGAPSASPPSPSPSRSSAAPATPAPVTKQVFTGRAPLAPRASQAPSPPRAPAAPKPASPASAVGAVDTARQLAVDEGAAGSLVGSDTTETATVTESGTQPRPEADAGDPTIVGKVSEITKRARESAIEWDLVPTQNVSGRELEAGEPGDRTTVLGQPSLLRVKPEPRSGERYGGPGRAGAAGKAPPSPTSSNRGAPGAALEPHDPEIETTQAVRVVVWRDANGVHVAPAGTVVSAITVDAVLVALEPRTDLTAWLTSKER